MDNFTLFDQPLCDKALVQNVELEEFDEASRYAWLSLITRETYEEAKKQLKGSAFYQDNQLVEDITTGLDLSYDQFDLKRQKELNLYKGDLSRVVSEKRLKSYLMPEQLDAWVNCIAVNSDAPVLVYVQKVTDTAATINIRYRGAAHTPENVKFMVNIKGAANDEKPKREIPIKKGGSFIFNITRASSNHEIRVVVNGESMSAEDTYIIKGDKRKHPPPPPASLRTQIKIDSIECSNAHVTAPPRNAFDGDENSAWNAGSHGQHWIRAHFQNPVDLTEIKLIISQAPPGHTKHEVYVGLEDGNRMLCAVFEGETSDRGILRKNVKVKRVLSIEVKTISSPSWIAWFEIEPIGRLSSI
ncbi:MAG TPA: discoidin domain-containing protein [Gammaproteobacteria bacterium]|nr:discoidin domain-containing protein [Gammaproteobacteria bacterium]